MASPGWYSDPSGQPNRFRFWDGQTWSEQTTADPYNTPPPGQVPPAQQSPEQQPPAQEPTPGQATGQPGQPPFGQPQPGQPQQPGQQSGWPQANQGYAGQPQGQYEPQGQHQPQGQYQSQHQPQGQPQHHSQAWSPTPTSGGTGKGSGKKIWLAVVGVVLVIALIIGGIFTAMALTGDDKSNDKAGGDESSEPSESGSESSEAESESTDPDSESADPDAQKRPVAGPECNAGSPLKGKSKSVKGRVVGGGLSIANPKGYKNMKFEKVFTFASDVDVTGKQVEPYWASTMAVGRLQASDYKSAKAAANAVIDCMAASDNFYSDFVSREDLVSKKTKINKLHAWRIRSEIRVDSPDIKAKGDIAEVIVVKLDKKRFGLFVGVAPIGDDPLLKTLKKTAASLKVG